MFMPAWENRAMRIPIIQAKPLLSSTMVTMNMIMAIRTKMARTMATNMEDAATITPMPLVSRPGPRLAAVARNIAVVSPLYTTPQ
jgi:hypothetical protein